jgi:excisionase family DNA binding protein
MNEEVLKMDSIKPGQSPLSSRWQPERGRVHTATLTLSIPDVAKLLGISNNLAYEAAARGEIPTVKIGRRVLVSRAALDRLLGAEAA